MLVDSLIRLKNRLRPDPFARHEIAQWVCDHLERETRGPARVLDIGLGGAEDLLEIKRARLGAEVEIFGIEYNPDRVRAARAKGIRVLAINVERERFPLDDGSVDAVIANHVVEHLKEVFFFFSEISRILKPGGIAVIGFPNLGGWQNRLALLFGAEPPCMRMLGSHVRGITVPGFRRFAEFGGFFRVRRVKGRAFYMLPPRFSRTAASLMPGLAAAVHVVLERTPKPGEFIEVLDMGVPGLEDTPYVRAGSTAGAQDLSNELNEMTT
jgi:SAM-dependent methyltransferase